MGPYFHGGAKLNFSKPDPAQILPTNCRFTRRSRSQSYGVIRMKRGLRRLAMVNRLLTFCCIFMIPSSGFVKSLCFASFRLFAIKLLVGIAMPPHNTHESEFGLPLSTPLGAFDFNDILRYIQKNG